MKFYKPKKGDTIRFLQPGGQLFLFEVDRTWQSYYDSMTVVRATSETRCEICDVLGLSHEQ